MKQILCMKIQPKRRFLGPLPDNQDLITSIVNFCNQEKIDMAVFSVIGAVSSYTIGTYDQKQQVYVTFTNNESCEIISCKGNILIRDGTPVINAKIILADHNGVITGGHLFSETNLFTGEIDIQELSGPAAKKIYNPETGLMVWDLPDITK